MDNMVIDGGSLYGQFVLLRQMLNLIHASRIAN